MGPSSPAVLLVAGRCRWVPGWPYYLATSMAHRHRAKVTMLGSTVDTCSSVDVLGGASFSSSSKWWILLLFTETGTHSVKLCKVVDCPVIAQRTFPLVSSADHRDFPVAVYWFGGRRGCAGPAFRVHAVRRQSRSHFCSPFFWTLSFAHPLCATTGAVVVDVLAQFIDGSHVPVITQRRLVSGSAPDSVIAGDSGHSSCATEKGTRLSACCLWWR